VKSYNKKVKVSRGYTLVELIVSVALFTIIVFISLGSLITVFGSNRRAQSTKTVVDNLNLTLENMVRTIRYGGTYHCSSGGTITNPQDCSGGSDFLALNFQGATYIYKLEGGAIKFSKDNGLNFTNLTSPSETTIEKLKFTVFNTTPDEYPSFSDKKQPYVLINIAGFVGNNQAKSSFSIQTMASQRDIDIKI
jgi:prepilin-type N-terminal cleavage/methylation domain-containing protein